MVDRITIGLLLLLLLLLTLSAYRDALNPARTIEPLLSNNAASSTTITSSSTTNNASTFATAPSDQYDQNHTDHQI